MKLTLKIKPTTSTVLFGIGAITASFGTGLLIPALGLVAGTTPVVAGFAIAGVVSTIESINIKGDKDVK